MSLLYKLKLKLFQMKWKKDNFQNQTVPSCIFLSQLVSVGKGTYGRLNVLTHDEKAKLYIGNYCSIAPEAAFILSADHYLSHISTYPFLVQTLNGKYEGVTKGDIIVDDDVWIGYGATIMSGVHIFQGAVIAARAVVTKDVPPYAIVGGVPAKVIKYRFLPETIERLMKIDYSKLDKETVEKNINKLYEPVTQDTELSWLPQKN